MKNALAFLVLTVLAVPALARRPVAQPDAQPPPPPAILLPQEGNYRPLSDNTKCDVHIETNGDRSSVFVTYIADQRSGLPCSNYATVSLTSCSAQGCAESSFEGNSLVSIDAQNFLYLDTKYTFDGDQPPQPASRFPGDAFQGLRADQTDCTIDFAGTQTSVKQITDEMVRAKYCPQAKEAAARKAIDDCQQASGTVCHVVQAGTGEVVNSFQDNSGYSQTDGSRINSCSDVNVYCTWSEAYASPIN